MQELIGRTLGHYTVVEMIGAGGMGEVYRVRDDRLNRDVAIKVILGPVATDEQRMERFEREAKLLASLSHQNIATLYGLEEHDGQRYLVMELAEGETLAHRIALRPIPIDDALDYAQQIAEGLEAAHKQGIIHRDLKPANVMVSPEGQIKILDFGLAKGFVSPGSSPSTPESIADSPTLTAAVTGTGVLLGTAAYMSPEQARGKKVDKRADVWAFGCVLFEMLTGKMAFQGDDPSQTMAAILRDDPDWTTLPIATPTSVRRLLSRCLTKDSRDRYHDIADVRIELQSLLARHKKNNGPNTHDPTSMVRPKWLSPTAVLVAAVLVFGTVAVIWYIGLKNNDGPAAADPPRIVVLPFENLGPPGDGYFADGITEEITSRLAAVSDLEVISRTSAMYYKGRQTPLQQIGAELEVEYALEGTIRWDRSGPGHGRVRITPQLIRVANDSHLWSDRYDRVIEDIFTVQSDIAEQVLARLQTVLLEPEQKAFRAPITENIEAYQAYLLGNQYLGVGGYERNARLAVEMLERAVRLDPRFAVAHATLSEAHSNMYLLKLDFTPDRLEMAKASAARALELQHGLPEGHRALGWYHYRGFRDYDRAREHFSLALEGLPNDENALAGVYSVNKRQGRWDEAVKHLERCARVDPKNWISATEGAVVLRLLRRYAEAETEMLRTISIAPDHIVVYYLGANNYVLWDGATDRARRLLESAPSIESARITYLAILLELYDRAPDVGLARLEEVRLESLTYQDCFIPKKLLECMCLSEKEEMPSARAACQSAVELLEREISARPQDHRLYSALGRALALLDRPEEARRAGEYAVELMPISKDAILGQQQEIELAKIYTRIGEFDKAINMIEELLSIPSEISVPLLRLDPMWDPLRDHPRFHALLEKYEQDTH